MQLFAFGVNHNTAPLAVREQVTFHAANLEEALRDLVNREPVTEAAIISTCNRTEVYCSTPEPGRAVDWLARFHHLKSQSLDPFLYTLPRERAVAHAFRVASGLDSMVLGEPQILGQMKDAVKSAEHAGTLGTVLHKLFQSTFSVAKEVRTQTEIGTNSVSMAAAAVKVAERIYPSIRDQNVLFIGAGEMIELCAAHFAAKQPRQATFANRTLERGEELAARFQGQAITFNDMPEQLPMHDIVVSCTASQLPILGKGMIERAIKARRHRPMLMIDLAVPRDIEAEVAELDDVFLYSVDDLGKIVQEGLDTRQAAVTQAEAIINASVHDFMHWFETRELVPTIRALRDHAERMRRHEFDRAAKLLAKGEDPQKVLEQLSHALTNKFLHAPTHALNSAEARERDSLLAALARLYRVNPPE
ncbi:MAG TPA: glutamyl-tRNA reductase [Burkholderiales bacterium]|jgi:glutamyl-tRNA reductase|nr:glutamyl-tRNA reductase [Burkholderiales bacterium]